MNEVTEKIKEIIDEQNKKAIQVTEMITKQNDRIETIEALMNRKNYGLHTESKGNLSVYIAESPEFKNFLAGNGDRVTVNLKDTEFKALLDDGSDEYGHGGIARPDRGGIYAPVQREFSIRELLPVIPTDSNLVEWIAERDYVNRAGEQSAPGAEKPESEMTLDVESAKVATIAHFINLPKQSLDDTSGLASHLDTRLLYGLRLREEASIIAGNGIIKGIEEEGNHVVFNRSVDAGTYIDQLGAAITQLQLTENKPNGMIVNPADWEVIKLLKTSTNEYIAGYPSGELVNRLWGLPVVVSNAIAEGGFIVGDFQRGAILFDRQSPTVEFSRNHDKNFTKNIVTILAEMRIAFAVVRPTAFVFGMFPEST